MRIKAKYAPLPIINTSVRFLVQVVEPVELVPEIIAITMLHANGKYILEVLKTQIHNQMTSYANDFSAYSGVTLEECDLKLEPKTE